ncbi:tripartite tricarboxylate transporter substrate binding protein [Bordetella sp. 15P40C-2]|uniref:Bug family tripartite tricarboxylate transporter substrate binding protein n=1 Tax=Bordetella sp. 15P40C-2 TaxID=2572246 RepID=UPI001326ED40|nr:tripartite tricarboxylate transporter substrate binding protein [Bordetella sp. 15P40C-2]MVW70327.1 ABC transporter substrate-binding protein [Bordetella sp. 15P40C-2]
MKTKTLFAMTSVVLALTASLTTTAAETSYPDKPLTLIVPFPPGGTSDVVGRILADSLSKELGQTIVVENKAGAGGTVGARAVASAKPDGYTLLLGTSSTNGTNSAVYRNLPYDAYKDFTPITQIIRVPGVIAVNKKFAGKDYPSFVETLKAEPKKHTYASSGNGGATHLAMEYYKSLTGLDITHVPYRGTGPALNDVIGGQVDMIWDTAASSMPHMLAGNLIPVMVAGKSRLAQLPDVPTAAEVGLPNYDAEMWNGLLAPAGLPDDVLKKLNAAAVRALKNPETQRRYEALGAYVIADTPEQFGEMVRNDVAKWKKVAEFGNIALD